MPNAPPTGWGAIHPKTKAEIENGLRGEYAVPHYIIAIDQTCWSYNGALWEMPAHIGDLFEDKYPLQCKSPIEFDSGGTIKCPVAWLLSNGKRVNA